MTLNSLLQNKINTITIFVIIIKSIIVLQNLKKVGNSGFIVKKIDSIGAIINTNIPRKVIETINIDSRTNIKHLGKRRFI